MTEKVFAPLLPTPLTQAKGDSPSVQAWRTFQRNPAAMTSLIVMIAIILTTILASSLAPYDPLKRDASVRLQPPSAEHALGTDALGRDILTRLLYGGRVSLQVGFFSIFLAALIGLPLGLIAGYAGGRVDNVLMRLMDVILAFPGLILAIWLVAMLGVSISNIIIAIAVGAAPTYARITRGIALSTRELDFVVAARSMGAGSVHILLVHILPSAVGSLIVLTTLSIAGSIIAGASLSFLGLGVRPPTPEWGAMLADGRGYLRNAWWMSVFPGMAIMLIVLTANILGDGLRDALDPQSQNR
jgi:peptide/nickel transport system permease protein